MGVQVDKFGSEEETKPAAKSFAKTFKVGYLQELKNELRQVTWTSKGELAMFARLVVGATFAFGLGIYGTDLLIKGCLTGFKTLIHLIFG